MASIADAHWQSGSRGLGAQSILYTPTSGIWRTVWLEPVPDQHITKLDIIPDVDRELLSVTVHGSSDAVNNELKLSVTDAGKEVAVQVGRVGKPFQVHHRRLPLGALILLWQQGLGCRAHARHVHAWVWVSGDCN